MHVIEQDMSTLRQGNNMNPLQYYDEVGKKLTLLTNKAHMFYEPSTAKMLCEKFREDALRIFISGQEPTSIEDQPPLSAQAP